MAPGRCSNQGPLGPEADALTTTPVRPLELAGNEICKIQYLFLNFLFQFFNISGSPSLSHGERFLKKNEMKIKPTFWFPTWSDTNQAVQLQKMARGLKFQI